MLSLYRQLNNRLLTFDPGYLNLRSAFRGTLAVTASYFVMAALAKAFGSTPTLSFLAVLMTMMTVIVVNDSKLADQKITTLLVPWPAATTAVLSVALAPWAHARLAVFLIITFLAVSIRRFGPRWTGIGIVSFMAYFATLFFPFHQSDIPSIVIAIVLAIGIAFAARFWLLPDRPRRIITLYLKAFDLRLNNTLSRVAKALRSSENNPAMIREAEPSRDWKDVRQSFIYLNELCIAIDLFLDTNDSKSIRSKSDGFQLKLFEHEMALRRLWDYSFELLHLEQRPKGLFLNAAVAIESLRKGQLTTVSEERFRALLDAMKNQSDDPALDNFLSALKNVKKTLDTQDFSQSDISTVVNDIKSKSQQVAAPAKAKDRLHISTRQAIQATLATTIASLLGTSLSPQRWYWASITAFMVFIGATRGETMMRAVLRILGTILGLILGFTLAYAFSGQTRLEWTLIVGCVFFGIFGARLTFGFWTAGLFSSMFALLYDILGLLNKDIIYLRLEETLIGAFIGVIVAAIVLPTSTHGVVRSALATYLRTLAGIIESLPSESPNPFARRALIRRLRSMDKELMDVRLAAAPIVGRASLMPHGGLPSALHDATMLAHYIRHLGINVDPRSELEEEEFAIACQELASGFRAEALAIDTDTLGKRETLPWSGKPSRNMSGPRHSLERIRVSLASLGSRKI
ncbi:MAG: hypothetical protein EOP07_16610 [Proteobacteria bacterium]|nr:MAG: hypothetical protein EOP07_16610 [Pseudomonadota bacterium]